MTAKKNFVVLLLITLSALALLMWTACDSSKPKAPAGKELEKLRLGTSALDLSALIWVAKGQGYFAKQGLDVSYKLYESGHLALPDLLAGNLDLATATDFATARACLRRPDLRIISILDETKDQTLVARKDQGIAQLSDLRNKRIGVARNTSSDYFLHLLLTLEKISPYDVRMVDLLPSEQVKAITNGDIDAAMVWEPFATMAKTALGANGVSWPGQSGQEEYWLLLSTDAIIKDRALAIERFLAALLSAEAFIKNNEAQALRLMAAELREGHVGSLWQNHIFRLGLSRPLILKMEAEMRWLKSKGNARPSEATDLLDFIYFDALRALRPEKVDIVH